MKKAKSILLKVVLVIVAFALIFAGFRYFANYSNGTRSGVVMKISKKGVAFKTLEGQLDVGTINDPWHFSVMESEDSELAQTLKEVERTGERVQLQYVEKYIQVPWRGDTKYFVTSVKRLE